MKKLLKGIMWPVIAVLSAAVLLLAFLTITEYKPADIESLEVLNNGETAISPEGEHSILSWNIGYCAIGKDSDSVLDGGGSAPAASEETVRENMNGILSLINNIDPEITFIQEIDTCSTRTFRIDQKEYFSRGSESFALNYNCKFVPFPWPPMAKVTSGIFTTTEYTVEQADRISLPVPFTWPMRVANLKRCLMDSYLPIEGSDSQLVLVNFHLEAYSSGESKLAQTKQLMEFVQQEYEKGNYVIAGGDWNQTFPGSLDVYPNNHEDLWDVGDIDSSLIPEGWTLACDMSAPTCRLLNQPYDPSDTENTQYYVIDGFICSPNVTVIEVETMNEEFVYSDHNPVLLTFSLS